MVREITTVRRAVGPVRSLEVGVDVFSGVRTRVTERTHSRYVRSATVLCALAVVGVVVVVFVMVVMVLVRLLVVVLPVVVAAKPRNQKVLPIAI